MKICFLTHDTNIATGGGRLASHIINGAKTAGNEVVILKAIQNDGEGVVVLRSGVWGLFISVFKSLKYASRCDIVHSLDGFPHGIVGGIVSKILRKKFMITAYGTYGVAPLYNVRTAWLMRWTYRQADVVIAISNYTRDEILKKVKLNNIGVINPGLDLNKFYQRHEMSDENFILGVGAAKQRKGYHISIPAFAKISSKFPDYKYYIVADDGREHLLPAAEREGVADKVVILEGITEDRLLELYRKAKLFILTSVSTSSHHFEGFGLVYLEAAAAGTPVIGTLGTGAVDAISNGQNGILVPQGDIDATADAVSKIISNDSMWNRMSLAGHEWVRTHSLVEMAREYQEFYKKILAKD